MKRLIVGLGNPGEEYAGTRHNAGFMLVDALAEELGIALREHHSEALSGWGTHRGFSVGLAKPLTYVNRSGEAVWGLLRTHDLGVEEVLVVVDDLNLETGVLRLRPGGGSGGHNGLESIAGRLGTTDYPRLRLGVGSDYPRGGQVEYVLSPFSEEQRPFFEQALKEAKEAALCFVTEGLEEAMNRFN